MTLKELRSLYTSLSILHEIIHQSASYSLLFSGYIVLFYSVSGGIGCEGKNENGPNIMALGPPAYFAVPISWRATLRFLFVVR